MTTIEQLADSVRTDWSCDHVTYAAFPKTPVDQHAYTLRHVALHVAKASGGVAALCEKVDHGQPIDKAELQLLATKSLINALKLAELADTDVNSLIQQAAQLLQQINAPHKEPLKVSA